MDGIIEGSAREICTYISEAPYLLKSHHTKPGGENTSQNIFTWLTDPHGLDMGKKKRGS